MIEITRRSFIGAVGATFLTTAGGLALAGCSGQAPQAASSAASASASAASAASSAAVDAFKLEGKGQPLTVGRRLKLVKIAPSVIAEKLGYYEEEGCNVTFETVDLAPAFASLANDELDVMLMGLVQTCEYIAKGSPLYIFGGTVLDGTEIVGPADFDKTLETPEDFKGLNIGFHRPETGQIPFRAWLIDAGMDINGGDMTFTPLDDETALCEAVLKGEIDIALVNNGYGYIYRDRGIKVLGAVKDYTGDYPCCRQNASNKAYHEKYLSLVDFEKAILRGYKVYKEDPDQTIPIMMEYSEQPEDVVRALLYGTDDYKAIMDLSPDPYVNATIKYYQSIKTVEENDPSTASTINFEACPSIQDYVTGDIYEDALTELMTREPDEQFWKDMQSQFQKNDE